MINFLKRVSGLTAVILAAALVAACGGGGSSDPAVVPPAPLLAQYQGTWAQGCEQVKAMSGVTIASNRVFVSIGSPTASGSVSEVVFEQYFNSVDCTGAAIATITDAPETITTAGTKTVGPITVVKVLLTSAGGTSTFSGPAVSTSVRVPGANPELAIKLGSGVDALTRTTSLTREAFAVKAIFSLVSTTSTPNSFDVGFGPNFDGTGTISVDAEGYPNNLSTNPIFGRLTKQ